MDPNETLKRIKELLKIRNLSRDESADLQELIEALDQWISKGGFLPTAWVKPRASRLGVPEGEPMNTGGVWPLVKN